MKTTIKILLTLTTISMIGIYACDGRNRLFFKIRRKSLYKLYRWYRIKPLLTFSSNKLKMSGDVLSALAGLLVDLTLLKNVGKNKSIYHLTIFGTDFYDRH